MPGSGVIINEKNKNPMLRQIVFILFCVSPAFSCEAQNKSSGQTKPERVERTVKQSLNEMAKSVEKTDWSSLTAILNTTITLIEQHVEVIEQVSKDIQIEGLEKDAEQLAKKLEDSSAIQDLENSLDQLADTLQQTRPADTSQQR